LNGLDDEARERALGMMEHFANSETFSLAEKDTLFTMLSMADDVFNKPKSEGVLGKRAKSKPDYLKVVN
jgi:hypothetical protein